jgi:transcription antitermination factor NusG
MATLPVLPESVLPASHREPHWYAVLTRARHEKRVAEQLQGKGIECFLPLYEALHRWKDRRKLVQLPLFPGYLFVRFALQNRLRVLQTVSVAEIVHFRGDPVPLPEREVEGLRSGLALLRAEPHPYLRVGQRVRIRSGPLTGSEGLLIRRKNSYRFVLSIDLIMRSIAVEVGAADIEPLRVGPGCARGHNLLRPSLKAGGTKTG